MKVLTHKYDPKEKIYDLDYRIQSFDISIGPDTVMIDDSEESKQVIEDSDYPIKDYDDV